MGSWASIRLLLQCSPLAQSPQHLDEMQNELKYPAPRQCHAIKFVSSRHLLSPNSSEKSLSQITTDDALLLICSDFDTGGAPGQLVVTHVHPSYLEEAHVFAHSWRHNHTYRPRAFQTDRNDGCQNCRRQIKSHAQECMEYSQAELYRDIFFFLMRQASRDV